MAVSRANAGRIYFVGSFLLFASVIATSPQPPLLRDYPDWVFQGVLFARALAGHPVAGYALKQYPVPNSLTTIALGIMTLAFNWLWAAKLWMIASLCLGMAAVFHAQRVFSAEHWLWWMLPGVMFFGQTFWYGTISFGIGSYFLLLLMCLLYRRIERPATIATLLLLCFFAHLIVYAAAGLLVLLYCLEHRRWKLTYVGLATLPLPLWYFAGRRLTPDNETVLGHSPATHLIVPAAVTTLFLLVLFLRPQRGSTRTLLGALGAGVGGLLSIAALSLFVPSGLLSERGESALFLLRMKVTTPLQLFGFVNIIYEPVSRPLRSASLTLLHRPLFLVLMLLDIGLGVAFVSALSAKLPRTARPPASFGGTVDSGAFLWHFVLLFILLYAFCPPNALGVISLDMRLAQLAFIPALFLLARHDEREQARRPPWLLGAVMAASFLLLLSSFYQFVVSQHRVQIVTTDTAPLRPPLANFGAVDPTAIAEEYDRLRTDRLQGFIFATGLFYQTIPWQPAAGVGR